MKVSLAEVLEWKYGKVADTIQEDLRDASDYPKMKITDWRHDSISKPDDSQLKKDVEDYLKSKEHQASQFDPTLCESRLYQVFQDRIDVMITYAGIILGLLKFKNFPAIKAIADLKLNPKDCADLKSIFLEQGLDLDLF